jgi:subtilisin family serine protease
MNRLFSQDAIIELQLDAVPSSISISGAVQGPGEIKVYALDQGTRKLVFDKSSLQIPENVDEDDMLDLQIFTLSCIETCSHTFSSNNIQLEIEVQDAFLYIEDLFYTIAQAPAQSQPEQQHVQPDVEEPVESEPEEELVDIIVQLKEKEPLPSLDVSQFDTLSAEEKEDLIGQIIKIRRAKIKKNQKEFLQETDVEEIDFQYDTVNAVAMTVKKSELNNIRNNPDVALVEADIPLFASIQTSVPLIGADKLWNQSIDGNGRSICVIDSGIDYTHSAWGSCTQQQFLAGNCAKIPFGYDFYNNDNDPMDDYYHGTHVAGISALSSSAYGVAPGAKIIAMKSLSNTGSGSTSQVLAGIDACVANASLYNISAITMSLGNNQVYSDATPCDQASIGLAISTATAAGIFVAVASGNNGGTTGVSYPACVSNATSIGSTIDTGWGTVDSMSSFTNRGLLLDMLAPGERINSTRNNNLWHTGAGTSQATPHVSGAAALLQHYSLKNNNILLTPHEIREILKRTGVVVFDSATNLSFPRIDVEAAANSLLSISGKTIQKTGKGKIIYPSHTDIKNAQYCINISQNKIEIDSSDNYCKNFNTSANITLNSVGFTKTPVILEDGSLCPSSICSLISWDGNDIEFNVQHFSAFSTAVNGNLTTYSSNDYPTVYEYVDFYANYTNYTSNPITNANCRIEFSDAVGQAAMNYNSGLYHYRRLFTANGSVTWTVNCTSNHEPYKISSTIYVLQSNNTNDTDRDGVPDFVDSLLGNVSNMSVIGAKQISLRINGSAGLNGRIFKGKLPVKINDNEDTLCNFTFNFSKSKFNMSKIAIKKDWYYTICSLGGQLEIGQRKTLHLPDNGYTSLCVKDAPGIKITNISDACNQANEIDFTSCIDNGPVTINGITCIDHGCIASDTCESPDREYLSWW